MHFIQAPPPQIYPKRNKKEVDEANNKSEQLGNVK
jgi:hypothetical protein